MTYQERLAEFVKVAGYKPGEMNLRKVHGAVAPCEQRYEQSASERQAAKFGDFRVGGERVAEQAEQAHEQRDEDEHDGNITRCGRYTRAVALGDVKPCKLGDGHEGPHEP